MRPTLLAAMTLLPIAACGASPRPPAAAANRPHSTTSKVRTPARATSPGAKAATTTTATPGEDRSLPAGEPAQPPLPPPAPLDATFGTADPVSVLSTAPDRRWLVACQARRDTTGDGAIRVEVGAQGELGGDALDAYLIDIPGPGIRIDAFAGSDPGGRYVAFVRDARLVLRDTTTHVDTVLDARADTRDDQSSFTHPRVAAFDPTGRRLLYLRRSSEGARIVVRDLAAGTETEIDFGSGEPWRAEFDPSGEWIVARVVATDTNGNGRLEWPVREAKQPNARCVGPLPRYAYWERPGDEVVTRIARATGGAATDAPGFVAFVGATRLERDPEGALLRVGADGKRAPVAVKACESHLVHADPERGVALITCLDKKSRAEVLLMKETGSPKSLGLALTVAPGDHVMKGSRLVPLHPGSDAVLVDLDRGGETTLLTPGDRILATFDTRAVLLRGRSLVVHELNGTEVLFGYVAPLAHLARTDPVLLVPPFVMNLATGELVGKTKERPLAVASDGALLIPEGGSADATALATGPLRWKMPEGAESSAPEATSHPSSRR